MILVLDFESYVIEGDIISLPLFVSQILSVAPTPELLSQDGKQKITPLLELPYWRDLVNILHRGTKYCSNVQLIQSLQSRHKQFISMSPNQNYIFKLQFLTHKNRRCSEQEYRS